MNAIGGASNETPSRQSPGPAPLGSIRADEVLPAELFRERMGISIKAWREMQHRGLRAVQSGKRQYVIGEHALAFFRKLADGEGQAE